MATYYVYDGQTYSSLEEVSKTVQAKHARAIMSVGQPTASHTPPIDYQCTLADMAEQLTQQYSAVQQLQQAVESQCRPAASVKLHDHFAVGQQLQQQPQVFTSTEQAAAPQLFVSQAVKEVLESPRQYQLSEVVPVPEEPVLKMEVGHWQICEDELGEFYVHAPSGQSFDQAPQELLHLLQQLPICMDHPSDIDEVWGLR